MSEQLNTDQTCIAAKQMNESFVREVWENNVYEEMKQLSALVQKYNYIAVDSEYPGIVAKPVDRLSANYYYDLIRYNVDMLNIIQIGFTLFDANGCVPQGVNTFQFNFKFDLNVDTYNESSIHMLTRSGVQFSKLKTDGIDANVFAELMLSSGLVLVDDIKWISFHGVFDFAHLIKILTNTSLPTQLTQFTDELNSYFPVLYDIKYLINCCQPFNGGLQDVALEFGVKSIGPPHQAGSDSYTAGVTFFEIRRKLFDNYIEQHKYSQHLYGLDNDWSHNSITYY